MPFDTATTEHQQRVQRYEALKAKHGVCPGKSFDPYAGMTAEQAALAEKADRRDRYQDRIAGPVVAAVA